VANGDISSISIFTATAGPSRQGGNAVRSILQVSVCVCVWDSACNEEIIACCNVNISSFFAFGVDMGYYDVVAGLEGDVAAVLSLVVCGCRVYGPCLNVA
jgi:hypothetical protein